MLQADARHDREGPALAFTVAYAQFDGLVRLRLVLRLSGLCDVLAYEEATGAPDEPDDL